MITVLAASALSSPASAHDVPPDVTVHAFVKPEGDRLHLLVRAPLAALRDVPFPTRGPGYLDLSRVEPSLRQAASGWIVDGISLYEDGVLLPPPRIAAVRVSLPSDRGFVSYEEARAHLTAAPLAATTDLYWAQAMLDVWLEYPIRSESSRFSIRPTLARLGLRVVTALRFVPPAGPVRALELSGDPGLVQLDPRWHEAARRFVGLGFQHILDGTDHLLFLLCLVIPLRRLRLLVPVVTSFTVAHSVTLIASALGLAPDALWFPRLVEALIAGSIVFMALENIVAPALRGRWVVAFAFGLVHGLGFSLALRQTLQFAGSHLLVSLLCFNVGIEVGQLLVLALLTPALGFAFRVVPERTGSIVVSALVAHTGWHWTVDRCDRFRQFPLSRPALDAAVLASAAGWMTLVVSAAGLVWLVLRVLLPAARGRAGRQPAALADE
jgi:hypothetical protein